MIGLNFASAEDAGNFAAFMQQAIDIVSAQPPPQPPPQPLYQQPHVHDSESTILISLFDYSQAHRQPGVYLFRSENELMK